MMNKKKIFLVVILLFLFKMNLIVAQNLVVNPSFENRNPDLMGCQATCAGNPFGFGCNNCCNSCLPPNGFSSVADVTSGTSGPQDALDWWANGGSSDFYQVGGTGGGAVPIGSGSNFFSDNAVTQSPRTGDAAGGIIVYNGAANPEYREYLINILSSPLVIGQQYGVEFYALLSNNSMRHTIELGAYFSNGVVPLQLGVIPAEESLQMHSNNTITSFDVQASAPISDNLNWTKICGVFTATTAATHLYIGNVKNAANTTLGNITQVGSSSWDGAYYYIDDVKVEAFSGSAANYCSGAILLSNALIAFYGKAIGNKNSLTWKVGLDKTDASFVIETLEGNNFIPLATIHSTVYKEDSEDSKTYYYEHENLQKSTTYYRLKQIDKSGSIQYSNVIALTNKNDLTSRAVFYPNPSTDNLSLSIKNEISETIRIIYTNILGTSIGEEQVNVSTGSHTYKLDYFNELPKGIYLLKILNEEGNIIGRHHQIIKK